MGSQYESLFVKDTSVWQAFELVLKLAEPFETDLKHLTYNLESAKLAEVMALHIWRPRFKLRGQFDSWVDHRSGESNFELDDPEDSTVEEGHTTDYLMAEASTADE